MINRSEDRFWELVAMVKWPCDYKLAKMKYLKILSKKECAVFRIKIEQAYCKLGNLTSNLMSDDNQGYAISDDGYNDLIYHIIGLGKEEFYRCVNNPDLVMQKIKANDYKESFSYCIPYESDYGEYSEYSLKALIRLAKHAMKEIDLYRKMDNGIMKWLNPINGELLDIEMLIQNFLDNPTIEGAEEVSGADWINKATKKISKFFEKNYLELPRKFTNARSDGSNYNGMCTALFDNFVSDAKSVIEFEKMEIEA